LVAAVYPSYRTYGDDEDAEFISRIEIRNSEQPEIEDQNVDILFEDETKVPWCITFVPGTPLLLAGNLKNGCVDVYEIACLKRHYAEVATAKRKTILVAYRRSNNLVHESERLNEVKMEHDEMKSLVERVFGVDDFVTETANDTITGASTVSRSLKTSHLMLCLIGGGGVEGVMGQVLNFL